MTGVGFSRTHIRIEQIAIPSGAELETVIRRVPALRSFAIRHSLGDATRNLKVLDWLAKASSLALDPETVPTASALIQMLWRYWIGSDKGSLARAGLMKRLGQIEGESLGFSIGLSELDQPELDTVEQLIGRDLLEMVGGNRARSPHPLLAAGVGR